MSLQLAEASYSASDETLDYWEAAIPEASAAAWIGCSPRTLQDYRLRGGGPPYIRIAHNMVRYRRIDLKRWLDGKVRNNTGGGDG